MWRRQMHLPSSQEVEAQNVVEPTNLQLKLTQITEDSSFCILIWKQSKFET
jgi:hypothetical protein